MNKHISQNPVYLTGSMKTITRTIYEDEGRFFIKWYGYYIEVINRFGFTNVTSGWVTVDQY